MLLPKGVTVHSHVVIITCSAMRVVSSLGVVLAQNE